MTSSIKNSRGRVGLRHCNPHNIDNLLSSSNTSTGDTCTSKVTDSSCNSGTRQASLGLYVPSLPFDPTSVTNAVDQLVKKHVKEELSKDKTDNQPTASPSPLTDSTTSGNSLQAEASGNNVQAEDVASNKIPKMESDDSVPVTTGRLSPLFPHLTGEEDSKAQEDKIPASSSHASYSSVLLSLTSNWSSIVTTILGICLPSCGEEPWGIPNDSDNEIRVDYSSQGCDHFMQDLLYNCDHRVAESIADNIIGKLNDGFATDRWTLDDVLQLEDDTVVVTEVNVALIVGKKFLHSLVRLLAIELSDPVIGGEEASERTNKNKSVITLIQ